MSDQSARPVIRSTTIIAVLKGGELAMAGDGQVTMDHVVVKHTARKIRSMYHGRVLAGFAGSVADAQTLAAKFEGHLELSSGNLTRAAVEFAKEWRTDRMLRRLEALMVVADTSKIYILSGDGNVLEPDDGVAAIGSGGAYAAAAAKALLRRTELGARAVVEEAISVAGEICVFTNANVTLECLP